ncbi:MAG TPA: class I SAM-dependent methyltransferase [Myxococcales bacterium]|jgi:SAM-dependent methyltransferase
MSRLIPRLQLFEFCDASWAPAPLRDSLVEALGGALERGHILDGLVEPFLTLTDRAGTREILDLGSGSGAPARILAEAFRAAGHLPPHILLSDLHPRVAAWEKAKAALPEALDFVRTPVDATKLSGYHAEGRICSVINVLHHLPPEAAQAVLQEITRVARGLFVAECFERNPLRFVPFVRPGIASLARTPLASREQRTARALLTWASPVSVLASAWDGVVSALRIHEIADLVRMTSAVSGWRFGSGYFRHGAFGRGFYFWGLPERHG